MYDNIKWVKQPNLENKKSMLSYIFNVHYLTKIENNLKEFNLCLCEALIRLSNNVIA